MWGCEDGVEVEWVCGSVLGRGLQLFEVYDRRGRRVIIKVRVEGESGGGSGGRGMIGGWLLPSKLSC